MLKLFSSQMQAPVAYENLCPLWKCYWCYLNKLIIDHVNDLWYISELITHLSASYLWYLSDGQGPVIRLIITHELIWIIFLYGPELISSQNLFKCPDYKAWHLEVGSSSPSNFLIVLVTHNALILHRLVLCSVPECCFVILTKGGNKSMTLTLFSV